jgi:hypothetical protein
MELLCSVPLAKRTGSAVVTVLFLDRSGSCTSNSAVRCTRRNRPVSLFQSTFKSSYVSFGQENNLDQC